MELQNPQQYLPELMKHYLFGLWNLTFSWDGI
jgi:hypothetical protein